MGVAAQLADYHLLDELVLLSQLVALELHLALQGLLLPPLALDLALQVLYGDVVLALHRLLLRNAPELIDFGLGAQRLSLPAPLVHLGSQLEHLLLLLPQAVLQLVVFVQLEFQSLVEAGSVLGVHA